MNYKTIDVASKPALDSLYYFYRVVSQPGEESTDDTFSIYSGVFELSSDFSNFIEIDRIICDTVKEKNNIPDDMVIILDLISKLN